MRWMFPRIVSRTGGGQSMNNNKWTPLPEPTLLEAAMDALESLRRLPDVDGAYRITCIQQLERAIANE